MAAGILFWMPLALFQGTAGYVTTFVAQYVGARQPQRVGPIIWQSLHFSLLAGFGFLLLVPLAGPIVALGGHEPHLQDLEATFLRYLAFSGLPMLITQSASGFFAGRGESRTVLLINVSGMAVYAVFAFLLIFGNATLGLPPGGIAGAGLAAIAGSSFSAALAMILMLQPRFRAEFATTISWRFDAALFGRLIRFGLPNGLGQALDPLVFSFFTQLVGRISPTALTATSVAFTLKSNTARLSASHSHLILCVVPHKSYQGGCDNDAARTLLGFGARCARHCGPVGRSQQGYLSGDHGASPVGNWTRPTTGLYVVASRDALGRAGNGYSHPSANAAADRSSANRLVQ